MEGGEIPVQQEFIKPIDKTIEDRFSQDKTNRFVEYITGLRLDNSELPNRLAEDQRIIRAKYGLSDTQHFREDISEYERFLKKISEDNGISLRDKFEHDSFFKKYPRATGCSSISDGIQNFVSIDRTSRETYLQSLNILEHETIHALQHKLYPRMNSELREYEAYVCGLNIDYISKNPNTLQEFFSSVVRSVDHWNNNMKKIPVWNTPEYFLTKVDGISEDVISKYKAEHQVDTEK